MVSQHTVYQGTVNSSVVRAAEALEIELLDHIILGQQRYVSLKERGLGF